MLLPGTVLAKFHADWSKTVGARGIHIGKQMFIQTFFNDIDETYKVEILYQH